MLQHLMFRSVHTCFLSSILSVLCIVNVWASEPVLDKTRFTATGYNETLLHITTPGRYSIQVKSSQGTAVELVDQMAGPIFSAGIVGEQDGRLDVLVDEGIYKIRLYSHKEGKGELELTAYLFKEVQPVKKPEDLSFLENLQLESGTLGDLQQRSFWIYLKERQIFRLEAMGRNLKDCRLWLDGEWLVDATPRISTYEPVLGQPMTYVEFYYDLNPGLYLLTCYGGEALAWANESKENPLYVRTGIPMIGSNGQKILTISPFGREVFVIPGDANFFELSRKDKKNTILQVGSWKAQGSRHSGGNQAVINKESRDPWCSLRAGSGREQVVTVQGNPGDRVVLKYFVIRTRYDFPRRTPNEYWISNQYSSEAADAIDATAVLVPIWTSYRRIVEKSQVLEVGANSPIVRKVNLLGELFVFLNVLDTGTYVIEEDPATGAKGWYQIEPLLFTKPKDYTPPPYMSPGTEIPLTRGFYVLSIKSESQGILSFVLRKKEEPTPSQEGNVSSFANLSSQGTGTESTLPRREGQGESVKTPFPNVLPLGAEERVVRQRILWPHVRLGSSDRYVLLLNNRPEVVSGFIVRPLPLDLSDPLPVTLLPGEQVPIDVNIQKKSKLVIENDQGASFEVFGYTQPISSDSILFPGKYTLTLKNTSQQVTLFTVKTVPAEVAPTLTKEELVRKFQGKPSFPVLTEKNPLYRNFSRAEKQHFTVLVEQPGLYRLETSGRLATSITVRNRFTTNLFSAEQNGIGRNALVQQYLKPGEYQVTVQPLGRSKGRAGIHLRRAALIEESGLRVGVQKKSHLVPDEAVCYRFEIDQAGKYRLRTLGLNKTFAWRLEDDEGWPLVPPNQQGELRYEFAPGTYHYYSLPDVVESRRVTILEKIEGKKPRLEGKGPHPITFNETVKHVWHEEPERPPDVFVLDVSDPVKATVKLAKDMEAGMYQCEPTPDPLRQPFDIAQDRAQDRLSQEGNCNEIAQIRGGKSREFEELLPGRYEFRVKSIEENDRLPYTLRVETNWLIPGLRYAVGRVPASFTVSIGNSSLVDIFSFGTTDVKATLWQGNRLVAQNDDMENDWNFQISQKLQAGTYLLKVEPVGIARYTENIYEEENNYEEEIEEENNYEEEDTEADTEMDPEADLEADTEANNKLLIGVTRRAEISLASQGFPFTVETEVGKDVVTIPFTTGTEAQLTRIHTAGQGVVKITLFQDDRMLAESEQDLFIPLKAKTRYTLLLWRLDASQGVITLETQPLSTHEVTLSPEKIIGQVAPPYVAEVQVAPDVELAAFKLTNAEKISYTLKGNVQSVFFSPDVEVPFIQVKDVPVVMPNRTGWLLWKTEHLSWGKSRFINLMEAASQYSSPEPQQESEREAQYTVAIFPFALGGEDGSTVVEVGQSPLPFGFERSTEAPMLLEIKSVGANLGAMIAKQDGVIKMGTTSEVAPFLQSFDWTGMWLEPSQTLVAVPGKGTYRAKIWPTSDEPVRGKVLLKTRTFVVKGQSDWGEALRREGELQPGESEKIKLHDAPQALDLLLTDGLVVFVWQNDHTEAMVAATNGNTRQRIGVSGGELILLNTGLKTALYRIEKRDAVSEILQTLDPAVGFEHVFTDSGMFVLKISEREKPIFVAGDQVQSRFFRDDGRIIEGSTANVPFAKSWLQYPTGPGLLEVSYKPGYVRIWQSEPEDAHQNFIGTLTLPAIEVQSLQTGAGTLENRDQLWTFSVERPTYIIAETEAPGITAILSQNRVLTTSAGSQNKGRQLDYFLQSGDYQLWTRSVKGLAQQGELRLHKVVPYVLDLDATSKTWLIRSGETQVFQFEVTTKSKVGVGVQTESDKLEAMLFDRQFTPIAKGPLIFKDLDAGEYILTVNTSEPNPMPVQYRPVVYGHHGSKRGIPADVMEQYQKLSGN